MQEGPRRQSVDLEYKRISKASLMIDNAEMTKIESKQETASQQVKATLSLLHTLNTAMGQVTMSTSPELHSFMMRV